MVFTLNTTVFAEEVAVDSVDDAVEATVDAVDEVAEEATVDAADATGSSDFYGENHYSKNDKDEVTSAITFSEGTNKGVNDVVQITNVDNPSSWNNIRRSATGLGYIGGADNLIETVLTGTDCEDTSLVNDKEITISNNASTVGSFTGEDYEKFGRYLRRGYRTYDVIDLGSDKMLFVGYGLDGDSSAVVDNASIMPVREFDGRAVEYNKSGKGKSTTSKIEALNVDVALVEYTGTTLKEIPGVTVASVKVDKKDKANRNASVSGQTITLTGQEYKNAAGETQKNGTQISYKGIGTLGKFTIKVKINNKSDAKDMKKAITDALKDKEYNFAISQKVVYVNQGSDGDMDKIINSGIIKAVGDKTEVSTNDVFKATGLMDDDGENFSSFSFSSTGGTNDFTISKLTDKKKANLVMNVTVDNGKVEKPATITLKAGEDYDLDEGTLAGTTVYPINFKGNYIYSDEANVSVDGTDGISGLGYKWAFRMTPSADGKKTKTFRPGIYRTGNDGFVYSVDETAVDSVEEAF